VGSLIFWVGPTHQNPEKTEGKFEFRKTLDEPVLQNPEKPWGKTAFQEFFGNPKNHGTPREDPNFEPCSLQENHEEFLDEPVLQNPETLRKNPRFENFLGPLKIAGNRRKIQNFDTCTLRENRKKIRILKPVLKISQLANPPIFLSFLLTSASK
jgi:hypothetical protein